MGRTSGWTYKPGQYLFLNCPSISRHEWHPFTISSSPEAEEFLSVHIRVVGNWTGKLQELLNPQEKDGIVQEYVSDPLLRVDAPYGAATEDVFKYEHLILIGAGIGVTPFASILKTIGHRLSMMGDESSPQISIKKVHFMWITRELSAFEWFLDLLEDLDDHDYRDFLDITIYITSKKFMDDQQQFGADSDGGLSERVFYGRPDWEKIFLEQGERYKGETVGVFFCGPRILSKNLYEYCRAHTRGKTKFVYKKENF